MDSKKFLDNRVKFIREMIQDIENNIAIHNAKMRKAQNQIEAVHSLNEIQRLEQLKNNLEWYDLEY